jgi:membrane-associated phospholipid phosphatase
MGLPFCYEQLQFMKELVSLRTPFLDPIFHFLNYADTPYFVYLLIPIVWIGFSSKWGIRLFYLLLINMLINTFFKELVGWPRPCQDHPSIGMMCMKSFGFPSGGAQTCMLLGALLIYSWRTRLSWVIGVSYIALVSFSRLYLGVHYPVDILGGWMIALVLFFLYIRTIGPIERFLHTKSLEVCLCLSEVLPLLLIALGASSKYHRLDAIAAGLGIYLSLKYKLYLPAPKNIPEGLLRGGIAVGGLCLLLALFQDTLPLSWLFGLLTLWVSLGASLVCRKVLSIKK